MGGYESPARIGALATGFQYRGLLMPQLRLECFIQVTSKATGSLGDGDGSMQLV